MQNPVSKGGFVVPRSVFKFHPKFSISLEYDFEMLVFWTSFFVKWNCQAYLSLRVVMRFKWGNVYGLILVAANDDVLPMQCYSQILYLSITSLDLYMSQPVLFLLVQQVKCGFGFLKVWMGVGVTHSVTDGLISHLSVCPTVCRVKGAWWLVMEEFWRTRR